MEEYKPNSHKSKEEKTMPEKRANKVVTGIVKTKKKTDMQKFKDSFITEDLANIKTYILMDVLLPNIKSAISSIVKNGIDMLLYQEIGRDQNQRRATVSKVSYERMFDNRDRREYRPARSSSYLDFDEVVFNSRGDAEAVLSAMDDIIDRYGVVRVADLYDLAEVSTTNYAINKYGWTDIHTAKVVPIREGGYLIQLPRALPLD